MANKPCTPCEINELQAWKCMMDSMVKFIQASTKLMNSFGEKSIEEGLRGVDCTPYDLCKIPNCEKCKNIGIVDESGTKRNEDCHEKCTICFPKKSSRCKCTRSPLKLTNNGEVNVQAIPSIDIVEDENTNERTVEISLTADNPIEKSAEPGTSYEDETYNQMFPEGAPPIPTDVSEEDKTDRRAIFDDENADITEESVQFQPIIKNQTNNTTPRQNFEDLSACICDELRKKEAEDKLAQETQYLPKTSQCKCKEVKETQYLSQCKCRDEVKELCSCSLTSVEKLELTEKMATKLRVAQEEIDQLKKELYQLQFSELTKHSQSAALYKEIMKESFLDSSFGTSTRSVPTGQPPNLKRPLSTTKQSSTKNTEIDMVTYQQMFTGKNVPLATSSVLNNDTLIGSKSVPGNWKNTTQFSQRTRLRCYDRESGNQQQSDHTTPQQFSKPIAYCTDQFSIEQQNFISTPVTGHQQSKLQQSYQQNGYRNYDFELSDDDSCTDEYNCGYEYCDKYRKNYFK